MSCGTCAKGVVGLVKAAVHIDRASVEVIQSRRDICRECEHATRNDRFKKTKGLTILSQCDLCSCFIAAKTVIQSEGCPLAKW